MKKLRIGLLAIAVITSIQSIKAQTADEIVEKYIAAMGGKEKLLSIKSIKMTGNLNVNGIDVGIVNTVVNGVGSRNDISVPGMDEGFQVVNKTKGWNFMPFQGQTAPEEITAEQLKASQNLLDAQGMLVNYKEKGSQLELQGKEKVNGAEAYKLKLTNKDGKVFTMFIDANTSYRIKAASKVNTPQGEAEIETIYSNFKKTDDGFVFPFSQTNPRGVIEWSSIDVNKPVDEKIFIVN